jgi:hypothetical protein
MTTQSLLGTAALGLAVIALVLALGKKGKARRPAAVLVPTAIILGTLHWVVQLPPLGEWLLGVVSLLLAAAGVWDLYQRRESHVGSG